MGTAAGSSSAAKRPLSRTAVLAAMLGALSSADACGSTSGVDGSRSGSGGGGNGGTAPPGTGGGVGLGGAATAGPTIGRACQTDADCGAPGAICLASASSGLSGGGPAHGLCTADCSADPSVCAAVDATSVCVGFAGNAGRAYCLEACTVGPVAAKKCHARPDVACDDSAGANGSGVGFCRPVCRGDVDCGGRQCDVGVGLCRDGSAILGTLSIGSGCDMTAVPDPCRGACVPLGPAATAGMCTGFCAIGTIGCGKDPTSTAPLGAACLFDGTIVGAGDVGDIGICGALCDCDAECTAPGRVCVPFAAANQAAFGRTGFCGGANDAQGQPQNHLPTCPLKR